MPQHLLGLFPSRAILVLLAISILLASHVVAQRDQSDELSVEIAARLAADRLPLSVFRSSIGPVLDGWFEVPLRRSSEEEDGLLLHVLVLPALSREPEADATFIIAGGPGDSASTMAETLISSNLRAKRDVVFVDRRGTMMRCPPLRHFPDLQSSLDGYTATKVQEAVRSLGESFDPACFLTHEAIEDYEEVRLWLGYTSINIIALSFGTREALLFMREHPTSVRCAALIDLLPLDCPIPEFFSVASQAAIDAVIDDCHNDPLCLEAYGDLRKKLDSVILSLKERPATLLQSGDTITIGWQVFAEGLRKCLYDPASVAHIPRIVHCAHAGDFLPFLETAYNNPTNPWLSGGNPLYWTIICSEEMPRIDIDEAASKSRSTFLGSSSLELYQRFYELWPRKPVDFDYFRQFSSDIPTLCISGRRDPVTPPHFASSTLQRFQNSLHVVIPYMGHTVIGLDEPDCLETVLSSFVDSGDPNKVETSCVQQMNPPPFFVDND